MSPVRFTVIKQWPSTQGQAGTSSETFTLSTVTAVATSKKVLTAGRIYRATVTGTVSNWNLILDHGSPEPDAMFPTSSAGRESTQVGIDAGTLFAWPTKFPHTAGSSSALTFDTGSGAKRLVPDGGPYTTPQPGHSYTFTITGEGGPLTVRWADSPLTDNYGAFSVTI